LLPIFCVLDSHFHGNDVDGGFLFCSAEGHNDVFVL
jgi:hypothetical protein